MLDIKIDNNLFSSEKSSEDTTLAAFLPSSFDSYLGQAVVKEKLQLYVKACKSRQDVLDHVLLFGPPGLGKTTLAKILATELGVSFRATSAPALEKSGDLVALLSSLEPKDVLFIDEIHRLNKNLEEILYPAMESFFVDIIIGQGAGARSMQLPVNKFTLVGATTKTGEISAPLQSRFGIVERLDFYQVQDLAAIVSKNCEKINLPISFDAALEIGRRSRGTPRIAKRIVRRVRDFVQVNGLQSIDLAAAKQALTFLNIDENGLDYLDQKVLYHLAKDFSGGPVGLETLAACAGEDAATVEEYCEPYLLRMGLIQKTSRGRKIAQGVSILVDDGKIKICRNEMLKFEY